MLIPRELTVEQNKWVKAMSDAQLEAAKETLQRMLEPRAPGDEAKWGAEAKPAPSL